MERLSGLDAFFLYMETPSQPLNVCCVLELDTSTMPGGYTYGRFHAALEKYVKAAPEFRMKLADTELNLDHPVWVDDDNFQIRHHLRRVAMPAPGGRRELAEICGYIAGLPLDRDRPLWEMWVIEGGARSDTVAVMLKPWSTVSPVRTCCPTCAACSPMRRHRNLSGAPVAAMCCR